MITLYLNVANNGYLVVDRVNISNQMCCCTVVSRLSITNYRSIYKDIYIV